MFKLEACFRMFYNEIKRNLCIECQVLFLPCTSQNAELYRSCRIYCSVYSLFVVKRSKSYKTYGFQTTFSYELFRAKMDELRMFLENEGWELCPVKSAFHVLNLVVCLHLMFDLHNISGCYTGLLCLFNDNFFCFFFHRV